MKKTSCIKLLLDATMAVLLVLTLNRFLIGQRFHEIVGLVLGVIVLVHIILNWSWIKRVSLNLFKASTGVRTRICFLVCILLFLGGVFQIISGLSISETLLINTIRLGNSFAFRILHESWVSCLSGSTWDLTGTGLYHCYGNHSVLKRAEQY